MELQQLWGRLIETIPWFSNKLQWLKNQSLNERKQRTKKKSEKLESRNKENVQNLIMNNIEAHEVQNIPNERVVDILKNIGTALDRNLDENEIDACHRLPINVSSGKQPAMILKFVK